ncbi:hypothetical protein L1Q99_27425, partial [Klebsiella pneumoniae]|uniref:hypothetical protein n=1 Tax=Klebsiella pneumoniae TaxID=573 RepID=UPI002DBC7BCD
PIDQLIQALGVIEQHSGRRAPQLRVKGHVFCSKKGVRSNEGLSERKVERDFFGIKQRRRGMWRRRTGRTIRGIL